MCSFKPKVLISALAGAGALARVGAANAVYVNGDGLGQSLIHPYYAVRDGNTMLLSAINTTEQAKAVRVRFLEGKNSQEVLDFNLFLSPKDVWTGAVIGADYIVAPEIKREGYVEIIDIKPMRQARAMDRRPPDLRRSG